MYKILEKLNVGGHTLKNRVAYLGMGKMLSTPDNYITERQILRLGTGTGPCGHTCCQKR